MSKRELSAEVAEARETLRNLLPPGSTVWTCVRDVARSGMSRTISCHIPAVSEHDGRAYIRDITHLVVEAVPGFAWSKDHAGIRMHGCGMDMCFETVYVLGRTLYPDGFTVGEKTLHRNGTADGSHDPDGGYALHKENL